MLPFGRLPLGGTGGGDKRGMEFIPILEYIRKFRGKCHTVCSDGGKMKKLPVVDYREHVKSNYYYEKKIRINAKYNVFLRKFKSFGCVLFERVSENQNRIKQPR